MESRFPGEPETRQVRRVTYVGGVHQRLPETRPKLVDHVRGRCQSKHPIQAMTTNLARSSPLSFGLYKRWRSSSVWVVWCVWVFSRGVFLLLVSAHTTSTSPPASRLHQRLASTNRRLPGPAHYSTLALWTPPFSTQAPPSEHRLHTCGLDRNNATRVGYHTMEHPSPEMPRYRKL